MLASNIAYRYVGRIAMKDPRGLIKRATTVVLNYKRWLYKNTKIVNLYVFEGLKRAETTQPLLVM